MPSAVAPLAGIKLVKSDWKEDWCVRDYIARTASGGQKIGGPLLVIQGEVDPNMNPATTKVAMDKTRAVDPDANFELVKLPGVTHTPAVVASRRVLMKWIADQFAGESVRKHFQESSLETVLVSDEVQKEFNWYLALATNPFQTML